MKFIIYKIDKLLCILVGVIVLCFFIGACQDQNELVPPTPITPPLGQGGIIGQLDSSPQEWDGKLIYAFAAPYLGPPDGEGIFILDEMLHPKGIIDEHGWFQINAIPPGSYVLVFGPNSEEAIAFREGIRAIRFEIVADELLDVGSLEISP